MSWWRKKPTPKRKRNRIKTKTAREWHECAVEAAERGDTARERRCLEKAIAKDPTFAMAYLHLSELLVELGELQESGRVLYAAIEAGVRDADVENRLGSLFRSVGALEEALPHFESAAELAPSQPMHWRNLGRTYTDLERFDEAITALEQAVLLDADHAEGLACLGTAYRSAGRAREAVEAFELAVALVDSEPQLHVNLGWAYFSLASVDGLEQDGVLSLNPEHLESALCAFEGCLRLDPAWASGHFGRGRIQQLLGRDSDHGETLSTLRALDPPLAEALEAGAVG